MCKMFSSFNFKNTYMYPHLDFFLSYYTVLMEYSLGIPNSLWIIYFMWNDYISHIQIFEFISYPLHFSFLSISLMSLSLTFS